MCIRMKSSNGWGKLIPLNIIAGVRNGQQVSNQQAKQKMTQVSNQQKVCQPVINQQAIVKVSGGFHGNHLSMKTSSKNKVRTNFLCAPSLSMSAG